MYVCVCVCVCTQKKKKRAAEEAEAAAAQEQAAPADGAQPEKKKKKVGAVQAHISQNEYMVLSTGTAWEECMYPSVCKDQSSMQDHA